MKQRNNIADKDVKVRYEFELDELIRYCDYFSAKYQQANRDAEAKSAECSELASRITQLDETIAAQKEEKEAFLETISAISEENNTLQATISEMTEEKEALVRHVWELIQMNEELEKKINSVKEEKEPLVQYVWELVSMNEQLDNRVDLLNKKIAKLQMQLSCIQAQNLRYQRAIQSITTKWYGKIMLKIYHFLRKIGLIK